MARRDGWCDQDIWRQRAQWRGLRRVPRARRYRPQADDGVSYDDSLYARLLVSSGASSNASITQHDQAVDTRVANLNYDRSTCELSASRPCGSAVTPLASRMDSRQDAPSTPSGRERP